MHLHTTMPLVFFLARASAQLHRMEFADDMRPVAADCPATADMPKCAVGCIDAAAADNGCASSSDLACQCKNYDAIQKAAAPCVIAACAAKAPDVISIASEICSQCAGIPVAAFMRETVVINNAVARTKNEFQWAVEPTGRVAPRRNWEDLKEQAEQKKWLTMPRMPVAGVAAETMVIDDHNLNRGAKETGRPVPRGTVHEELGSLQQAERKQWNNKMPRDKMVEDMTDSKTQRLNSRKSPELPDFGSDKSPMLRPFNKDCSEVLKGGSGSLRSCDDEHDWDHDNNLEGNQEVALERMRANTWRKRKIDLGYEQELEQERQLKKEDLEKKMMAEKGERKMNKDSEQRKWM
ncbi:hypothetical protein QBC36DRAFT_37636 [Triangularia setosa]|uniref:CFEM domain-containing protein n=1 Tax=Triangularia setosa TaxID=2587417 RepID=A0AAN6W412_9PEZI|nr:hypothetical protein QBC36DRAFT_37636 [Podospora setosa]